MLGIVYQTIIVMQQVVTNATIHLCKSFDPNDNILDYVAFVGYSALTGVEPSN